MVKSVPRKAVRPKKKQAKTKRNAVVKRVTSQLDNGAKMFARMLMDPCNAPLTAPTYSGMGTGVYRRFRSVFNIPTSVEGTYMFTPGSNIQTVATHVAANAGNVYTFNQSIIFATAELDGHIESRCLAACVKVRYIGPETSRAGVIGLRTSPFAYLANGETSFNRTMQSECPQLNRTGEVLHEVKFVPGSGDEIFSGNLGSGALLNKTQGSFGFTYAAVPDASLQVEVTAIIELETRSGLLPNIAPPTSSNTTNQVLGALGPPARWAFGHVIAPTIRAMAGAATNTVSNAMSAYTSPALLLSL